MNTLLRKYGEAATVTFDLFEVDGIDFRVDAVHASGDTAIMKDEGAEANTTNGFTDEGNGYSLLLSATEMQAARIVIYAIDQTATKVWLDRTIVINTYGNASAQHAFDLDTASVAQSADNDTKLTTIDTVVDGIQTDLDNGTDGLGAIKADTAATLVDTAEIGAAGAGLTDLGGMSTGMQAEVNTEVDTGIADANLATSSQVSGIANVGSATNTPMEADNTGGAFTAPSTAFVGNVTANTFAAVEALDGVYHNISDATNVIDVVYRADVTGNGVASSVQWTGYLDGSNDSLNVHAWDFTGTPAWVQIGTIDGQASTTNIVKSFDLFTAMTGTLAGTDLGKVYIRMEGTATNQDLFSDQLFVSYSTVSQSVGYALGRVWVDTVDGTAGTESFVNGVADNPVLTFADAITIANNLTMHEFNISPESTLTLAADLNNSNVYGVGYVLELAGFDIAGSHFFHSGNVSGTYTAQNNSRHADFVDSIIFNTTGDDGHYSNCSFGGTLTMSATQAGDMKLVNCRSIIAGATTPIIDFGTGAGINHNLTLANWQNGIEFRNFNNSGTDLLSISGTGKIVYASSCSGTVNQRGSFNVTNTGGVTITADDNTTDIGLIIVDTADMQPKLGTPSADISADIAALPTAAEINAEMVDVMETDTHAEPSGVVGATASLKDAIMWLKTLHRNKMTQTATTTLLRNDADSGTISTSTVSDDGTTFIRGKHT